jgi:L-fuconolactonase
MASTDVAAAQEAPLEPDLPIIDAHHHLWTDMGWRTDYPVTYLPADFIAAAAGHRVVASVFLECRMGYREDGPEAMRPVGETEFAAAVAEGQASAPMKMCAGIVGYADLGLGARAGEVLDAHLEAGRGRFRGVRARVTWADDPAFTAGLISGPPHMLLEPRRGDGARELIKRGLSLDVWMYQTQLADLATFAQEHPDLVLNHIGAFLAVGGFAERREETFAQWKAGLAEVAKRPNVVLKVGGFGMKIVSPQLVAHGSATSDQMVEAWRPLFETCVETFGPDRCMLESNFPVDGLSGGYRQFWNAFKRLTQGYSADERTALFSGVAARTYRLEIAE